MLHASSCSAQAEERQGCDDYTYRIAHRAGTAYSQSSTRGSTLQLRHRTPRCAALPWATECSQNEFGEQRFRLARYIRLASKGLDVPMTHNLGTLTSRTTNGNTESDILPRCVAISLCYCLPQCCDSSRFSFQRFEEHRKLESQGCSEDIQGGAVCRAEGV